MITKEKLIEEADAIYRFIYLENHDAWLKFCDECRIDRGNQSLEHTTALVRSLTQPQPWRFIITDKELKAFDGLATILIALGQKIRGMSKREVVGTEEVPR